MGEFRELLQHIRMGDVLALNRLLAMWRPFLHRNAHRRLRSSVVSRADTSDVVQNALLQVAENVVGFRGDTEAEWAAWLQTILSGQAGKICRFHHCSKRTVDREENYQDVSATWIEDISAPASDDVELDELQRAIDALSTTMKDVLWRRVFERQPYELIAQELEISSGNARVLFTRAIRKLKAVMDKE